MRIMSACCRLRDSKDVPLLLQQYQYKGIQVFFACVCIGGGQAGDGDYMAKRLLAWFRGLGPDKLSGRPGKAVDKLSVGLDEVIRRTDRELEDGGAAARVGFAGIACIGDHYLMLHRGRQRIYMVNRAFDRVYVRRLYRDEADGECMERGILQPDVGLLFAPEPFYAHISDTMIKEALCVWETATEEQMGRRLKELVEEGGRRGDAGIGAIYLKTLCDGHG